jgi:hypothetical protein
MDQEDVPARTRMLISAVGALSHYVHVCTRGNISRKMQGVS